MPVAPPGMRWQEEVDVGIVGAGGCGLVAAHATAQVQLKTVIWEAADAAGGGTAASWGVVAAAGTRFQRAAGIFETGADFARDVAVRAGARADPALTSRLCDSSAALVEWLVDARGIDLELVPQTYAPGHSQPRLHAPRSRSGEELLEGLLRSLERRGISLRLSTPVLQLWSDGEGAVNGVRVKPPRKGPVNVRCQKLILATDGFGANRELLLQHCAAAGGLSYAGGATSRGDALGWAAEIGAATRNLDAYEAYASVAVGSNLVVPWTVIASGAILVNQRGERFADETLGPTLLVAPVLAQPGHVAYEILDGRVLSQVTAENPHFASTVVPRAVRRADDAGGLAKQFQIDTTTLESSIAAYNAAVVNGGDAFGRNTFGAPLTAPFYGIRVAPALMQTYGGVAIDSSARVLRADGAVIPNLYAGGSAVAGLAGPGADGTLLGMGLLSAFGWGKIAGEQAAHEIVAARATAAAPAEHPGPDGEPSG